MDRNNFYIILSDCHYFVYLKKMFQIDHFRGVLYYLKHIKFVGTMFSWIMGFWLMRVFSLSMRKLTLSKKIMEDVKSWNWATHEYCEKWATMNSNYSTVICNDLKQYLCWPTFTCYNFVQTKINSFIQHSNRWIILNSFTCLLD